jgi:hypothetical protein
MRCTLQFLSHTSFTMPASRAFQIREAGQAWGTESWRPAPLTRTKMPEAQAFGTWEELWFRPPWQRGLHQGWNAQDPGIWYLGGRRAGSGVSHQGWPRPGRRWPHQARNARVPGIPDLGGDIVLGKGSKHAVGSSARLASPYLTLPRWGSQVG